VICPYCGQLWDGADVFCPNCGTSVLAEADHALPPSIKPVQTRHVSLRRERNIYLMLTLIPLLVLMIANALLLYWFFSTPELTRESINLTTNLFRALVSIPCLGLMMYGLIRYGRYLNFGAGEWVIAILLLLFCTLGSIIYMLLKS